MHDYKATGAHLLLCPVLCVPLKLPLALPLALELALSPLLQVHQMPLEDLLPLSRLNLRQGSNLECPHALKCLIIAVKLLIPLSSQRTPRGLQVHNVPLDNPFLPPSCLKLQQCSVSIS